MINLSSDQIREKVLIGKGGFASVFKIQTISGQVYALKSIDVQLNNF